MPAGRPSSYTPELGERFCEMLATQTGGIWQVCWEEEDMPSERTIYRWLAEHEEFRQQYARAKEQQADFLAGAVVRIADNEADPQKARVRIDARKWAAGKLAPKKYGDKTTVEPGDKPFTVVVQSALADV